MAGNSQYGRGAYDTGVRIMEAMAADRRNRMRYLKYVVVLGAPLVFYVSEKLKQKRS